MNIKLHYRPEKVKKYEARWYVEGRLKCRFFATENERERFIEEFQEQLSQNGTSLLLGNYQVVAGATSEAAEEDRYRVRFRIGKGCTFP